MATSEESLLQENIQEYVNDENKIVTCKWLSLTLSIHINVAKQALCNFVDDERNKGGNDDINVTYFVSGLGKSKLDQSVLKCVVVPESELEAVKATLDPITSIHIYSVSRSKLKDHNALYQTDLEAVEDNLANHKKNSIKCPWASIKSHNADTVRSKKAESPKPEKVQPSTAAPSKVSSTKANEAKKPKATSIASMFAGAGKKAKKEPVTSEEDKGKKESQSSERKETAKAKPKETKKGVMSFFKSQPEKRDAKEKEKEKEKETVVEKQPTKETNNKKKESKSSNSTVSKKHKATSDDAGPQKKRRRIRTDLFDSSDDEDKDEDQEEEEERILRGINDEEEEATEIPEVTGKQESAKEESDEEMVVEHVDSPKSEERPKMEEDVKVIKQKRDNSGGPKRKRVRRLVPKQHIDEDGFMVTEKVWESDSTDASDNEEEQKQQQKQQQKTSPKPSSKAAAPPPSKAAGGAKKKAAKPSPSKNKQTSLMSFFKKT